VVVIVSILRTPLSKLGRNFLILLTRFVLQFFDRTEVRKQTSGIKNEGYFVKKVRYTWRALLLGRVKANLRHMSPAPTGGVVLNCNNESELGGSLKKKQKTNRVKRKGPFRPDPESGILRKDAITTISQEAK
jgi:hypothetical protein